MHCRVLISNNAIGTSNRNHCPLCLYSKHLDLFIPGDRKCTCHAKMKPIALTYKPERNVFSKNTTYELMLVHECTQCGQFSKNRLAGDDNEHSIERLFYESFDLPVNKLKMLDSIAIKILTKNDEDTVMRSLYGI